MKPDALVGFQLDAHAQESPGLERDRAHLIQRIREEFTSHRVDPAHVVFASEEDELPSFQQFAECDVNGLKDDVGTYAWEIARGAEIIGHKVGVLILREQALSRVWIYTAIRDEHLARQVVLDTLRRQLTLQRIVVHNCREKEMFTRNFGFIGRVRLMTDGQVPAHVLVEHQRDLVAVSPDDDDLNYCLLWGVPDARNMRRKRQRNPHPEVPPEVSAR